MQPRAFLYARTAVVDPGAEHVPLVQLDACRAYAGAHGYRVVAESTDIGSGLALDRPGLTSLLAMSRQGAIDVIVVRDWDRLTRCTVDALRLEAEFNGLGVRVETVTPPAELPVPALMAETVAALRSALGAAQ